MIMKLEYFKLFIRQLCRGNNNHILNKSQTSKQIESHTRLPEQNNVIITNLQRDPFML